MALKTLLDKAFKENGKDTRGGEVLYTCPKCNHHKPKLSVNLETQNWKCWVCSHTYNTKGKSIKTLFKMLNVGRHLYDELKKLRLIKSVDIIHNVDENVCLPPEFKSLCYPQKEPEYKLALNYLKKRGITLQEIIKYNIGYCADGDYKNRVIIPSYDFNGSLNYFISRSWLKDHPLKYKNPPCSKNVIGFELFVNWNLDIQLCEGAFDCIAIRRNAIPLFGKTLNDNLKLKLLQHMPPTVNVCLDIDAIESALVICDWLDSNGINNKMVTFDQKDPSEMGYRKTWECINSAKSISFKDKLTLKL